jgi:hypothetical protein
MKIIRFILLLAIALLFIVPFSGCATKKRVLVIECPTYKPSELNKEGFKTENKRRKSLDKENRNRQKERN